MSSDPEKTVTISLPELEAIIQRTVREAVREEMRRALKTPLCRLVEELVHEGPDDPAGDEQLLAEALVMLQRHGDDHKNWITLEELEAELATENNAVHSLKNI